MMGCSRKIIYFSMYRNGIKAEPAGHAVLWQNGAACRLEYHCRLADASVITPTYYFAGGASIVGEPMAAGVVGGGALGTAGVQNVVSYCVKTSTEHFLGSEKKASDLEAICFGDTPMEYGGGRVDGAELHYANGEGELHPAQIWMDTVAETALNSQPKEWQQPPEKRLEEMPKTQIWKKKVSEQTPYKTSFRFGQVEQKEETLSECPQEEERNRQDTETESLKFPKRMETDVTYTFPELLGILPKLSLPPDGIRRQCCRMELSDLEKFPKKWKGLENNHFLLHGYYQYHHLLLVQLSGVRGEQYAVGVPGEFRYRDQYMAETFGFSAFYPLKKGNRRQGEFGYWYLYLT